MKLKIRETQNKPTEPELEFYLEGYSDSNSVVLSAINSENHKWSILKITSEGLHRYAGINGTGLPLGSSNRIKDITTTVSDSPEIDRDALMKWLNIKIGEVDTTSSIVFDPSYRSGLCLSSLKSLLFHGYFDKS